MVRMHGTCVLVIGIRQEHKVMSDEALKMTKS